ncbi:hypothetical protein EVAR_33540_1 [Eumeta japonica]|uniref:Protein kinase domain-containing protein n=1 Tax=Eumeta variegata TaxID=151549 RepID=A0A4C1VJU0_EUMVA|nr:hypothetical protein EVAR_33540_1 [Eumeta japonica]
MDVQTPIKNEKFLKEDIINIPPSPFLNRLGYGTGVSVLQLVRSPRAGQMRSPWALKMINKKVKPNRIFSERLQAEAALLKKMSHPNIVGFRAFDKGKILYLGMEACDISLGDMIEQRVEIDDGPFSPKHILKVAIDVGNALDYLHTKMLILHGDMKSYNILVNGDFNICKLCDFGVTLPLDENGAVDQTKAGKAVYFGTEAWSAPEVIHGGVIGYKSDVFSYGLVFWEMMALMPPHLNIDDTTLDESVVCLDDEDIFCDKYGTRPAIPVNICSEKYADPLALFYCCTESLPAMRPSARHIVLCAEDMMTKMISSIVSE